MRDVMLDLETMGNGPDAAIVAIGAVEFDPDAQTVGERLDLLVDLASAVSGGGVMDPATVLWWLRQGDLARSDITDSDVDIKTIAEAVSKKLVDRGCLIEAGWQSLRTLSLPADAPPMQLEEMRNAFFAGAHHVFGTMINMLDPDKEPTDNDLRRMSMIHSELTQFIAEYKKRHQL